MKRQHFISKIVAVSVLVFAGTNLPATSQESADLITTLAQSRVALAQAFVFAVEAAKRIAEKAAAGDLEGVAAEQARSKEIVKGLSDALAAVDQMMKAVEENNKSDAEAALSDVQNALQGVVNAFAGIPSPEVELVAGEEPELDNQMTGGATPVNPYAYLGDPDYLREVGAAIFEAYKESTMGGTGNQATPE